MDPLPTEDRVVISGPSFTPPLPAALALAFGHDGRAEFGAPYSGLVKRSLDERNQPIDCETGSQLIERGVAQAKAAPVQPPSGSTTVIETQSAIAKKQI